MKMTIGLCGDVDGLHGKEFGELKMVVRRIYEAVNRQQKPDYNECINA